MKTGTTKGVRLDSPAECASREKDADAFDQIAKMKTELSRHT